MTFVPDHLPIRALCVTDDPSQAERLVACLAGLPFDAVTTVATSAGETMATVAAGPVDVVVVDCQLAAAPALDLIERIGSDGGPPIIAVSGASCERNAVAAMKRGATDFLQKGESLREEIPRAVVEALERRSRRSAKRRATRELEVLAFTDPLTSLWNRRYFEEAFAREFASARRYGHPLSLLVVDFDHFKAVNDTWGHPAGDRVLSEAAHRIQEAIRVSDLAARYGGEEFVILLPCSPPTGAGMVATRVLDCVRAAPFHGSAEPLRVTASGGLATLTTGRLYAAAPMLFGAADAALYRAKAEGRDRLGLAPAEGPAIDEAPRRDGPPVPARRPLA